MKKIIIVILTGIFLLHLCSCAVEEDSGDSLKDALKISAYLFDENTPEPVEFDDNTVFTLEQLQLNEVRIMAPTIGAMDVQNLNILFEFEGGIFEVISEDKEIQLSVDNTNEPWHVDNGVSGRTFGFNMKFMAEGWISACPLGSGTGNIMGRTTDVVTFEGYTGREYYLTVNAYTLDNDKAPVIRAKLKLVQLTDIGSLDVLKWDKVSRLFSIELIEYEYSDTYKMMEQ